MGLSLHQLFYLVPFFFFCSLSVSILIYMEHKMADLDALNEQIIRYNLQFQTFDPSILGWKVSKSQIAGKGLLATKKYKPGDTIFVDHPLVVGPRYIPDLKPFCVTCYSGENLRSCSRECRLPVCSTECECSERHAAECAYLRKLNGDEGAETDWDLNRFKALTVVRCLAFDKLARKIVYNLHKIRGRARNEVSPTLAVESLETGNECGKCKTNQVPLTSVL